MMTEDSQGVKCFIVYIFSGHSAAGTAGTEKPSLRYEGWVNLLTGFVTFVPIFNEFDVEPCHLVATNAS